MLTVRYRYTKEAELALESAELVECALERTELVEFAGLPQFQELGEFSEFITIENLADINEWNFLEFMAYKVSGEVVSLDHMVSVPRNEVREVRDISKVARDFGFTSLTLLDEGKPIINIV